MAIKNFYTGVYVGDNLGVGVASPGTKLHVVDNAEGAQVRIGSDASNELSIEVLGDGDSIINAKTSSFLQPNIHFNVGGVTKLAINGAFGGNIGIWTINPARQLTLDGNSSPIVSLRSNTTGGEPSVYFGDTADDNEGRIVYSNSQDAMQIWTAAEEQIRITSAGDVGIGVQVPGAKLDVEGGVKIGGDTDSASVNKVGTLRYRYAPDFPKSQSMVDMCMQTGTGTYAWVNIVTNTWNN